MRYMRFFTKWYYTKNDMDGLIREKRKLSLKYHPDRGGVASWFAEMMDEFETIESAIHNTGAFWTPPRPPVERIPGVPYNPFHTASTYKKKEPPTKPLTKKEKVIQFFRTVFCSDRSNWIWLDYIFEPFLILNRLLKSIPDIFLNRLAVLLTIVSIHIISLPLGIVALTFLFIKKQLQYYTTFMIIWLGGLPIWNNDERSKILFLIIIVLAFVGHMISINRESEETEISV